MYMENVTPILTWFTKLSANIAASFFVQGGVRVVLDIALVAGLLYGAYTLVRNTRAIRIAYGLAMLGGLFLVSNTLGLTTLTWVIRTFSAAFIIALPILFQPELRRALERLGRSPFLAGRGLYNHASLTPTVKLIVDAVRVLAHHRLGALLVLLRSDTLNEYLDTGTIVNADLSTELILNIFTKGAPLHDGALLIHHDRIVAASVMLPLSEGDYSFRYGARHRAGIGITEVSDAVAVIVSETEGSVALAHDGILYPRLTAEQVGTRLAALL